MSHRQPSLTSVSELIFSSVCCDEESSRSSEKGTLQEPPSSARQMICFHNNSNQTLLATICLKTKLLQQLTCGGRQDSPLKDPTVTCGPPRPCPLRPHAAASLGSCSQLVCMSRAHDGGPGGPGQRGRDTSPCIIEDPSPSNTAPRWKSCV